MAKLKRHALRAPLAKPEILNGGPRYRTGPARHSKNLALPEVDERLVASRVGAL